MSGSPRLAPSTLGLIAVGVVAVSMSGPVMASLAVPALVISFWRNGLATLLLAPVAVVRRRAEIAGLSHSELGWIVASGVCLAVHFGTWVTSLSMTSVAASTAIVCLQIAWVAGWDRFTGVRLPARAVAGLVAAFVGVLVITGVDLSVSTRAVAGDLLALAGSVAVAAYTVIGGRARRTVSTTSYTFVCYGTAALLLMVASLVSGASLVGYDAREWALIAAGHADLAAARALGVQLPAGPDPSGGGLAGDPARDSGCRAARRRLPRAGAPAGGVRGSRADPGGMALVVLEGPDRTDEPAITDL